MNAKLVDTGTLACTRNTANANANTVAGVWQALLNDFLSDDLVLGNGALYKCDGLSQNGNVAFQDAFHIVAGREVTAGKALPVEVRVDRRYRSHTAIHGQACIFGIILGMFHFSS